MNTTAQRFQQDFIELALECDVLQFGEFELKSGRISPYFFNAGKFSTGDALSRLGRCYAAALHASGEASRGCDQAPVAAGEYAAVRPRPDLAERLRGATSASLVSVAR